MFPIVLFFLLRQGFILSLRLECSGTISAHSNLCLLGSSDSPASASQAVGITSVSSHLANFWIFCRDGHVCQAGLELLASRNPLASVSQSTGITGVSHHTWSKINFQKAILFCLDSSFRLSNEAYVDSLLCDICIY